MSLRLPAHLTIGVRLVALVLALLLPLIGLQVYHLIDDYHKARQQTLSQTQGLARTLRTHVDYQVRKVDALLHTIAVTVPVGVADAAAGHAALYAIRQGLPAQMECLSFFSPDGALLYSSELASAAHGSVDVSDQAYFRMALISDRLQVSPPMLSRSSGKWVVYMARAIRGADGRVVGVIKASKRLEYLKHALLEFELPSGSVVTLLTQEGLILARSLQAAQWVGQDVSAIPEVQQALQRAWQEGDGAIELFGGIDGVPRLSAFASGTEAPWLVYVGVPTELAMGPARSNLYRYLLATVLLALLALGAALFIGLSIRQRLRQLQQDAATLAEGRLEHRSQLFGGDEIGELATHFNAMAASLELRSEQARTSATMLRQYVENTPAAIAMLDTQMRYLLTSRRWLSDYRLQESDLVGRSHYEVFPEITPAWRAAHQRCLAGAVERADAQPFVRADGTTDWVRWEVRPWYRAEGSVGGITIFSEVVTEQVRREQEIRDITHRLGAAVRGGRVGLWDRDLRSGEVYYSREWKQMLGYTEEEIGPDYEEWRSRLHPDDAEMAQQAARELIERKRPDYSIEFRLRHRDGSYRWIFSQGALQLDAQGVPARMTGSHIDVTEQRQLREERSALGEKLTRLLDATQEGFAQFDANWTCLYLNRRAYEILGRKPGAIIGHNLWHEYPVNLGGAFHAACLRALREHRNLQVEQFYEREQQWYEYRIYPIDDGTAIFFADITERKLADAALRQAAAELRALSARLAQTQESERRALAAELHDQVGQNLTALNLIFTLLRSEVAKCAPAGAVARIDDGMELVGETVARVRDLMVELRPPMLDDYGLLAALRWYVQRLATRAGIEAHVDGSEPEPRLSDEVETALFRIAQEALNNVLKHAQARHVHVWLDTTAQGTELVIEDDGCGFDAAANGPGGPGWGLASMRERATAIGGKLDFESTPGAGTRVVVRLERA